MNVLSECVSAITTVFDSWKKIKTLVFCLHYQTIYMSIIRRIRTIMFDVKRSFFKRQIKQWVQSKRKRKSISRYADDIQKSLKVSSVQEAVDKLLYVSPEIWRDFTLKPLSGLIVRICSWTSVRCVLLISHGSALMLGLNFSLKCNRDLTF